MTRSDVEAVLGDFVGWLDDQRHGTRHTITAHTIPSVGYSGETIIVDVRCVDAHGVTEDHLALKLEPSGPALFPVYDFSGQARVQTVVADQGVPAPVPAVAESDRRWVGRPFLVMPAVAGHIVEEMPISDPWLTDHPDELARRMQSNYIDTVADINRIDWRSAGLADVVPVRDNTAEIGYWREFLDWYGGGEVIVPTLVEALDWCDTNRPAREPDPSLLWGDVRLGNVIFDDDRSPVAVIDWEMATIGTAEHDLAWTLVLQDTQDRLFRRTVPGFLHHDELVERYEHRLGRAVQDFGWYEVFAMVRSCALFARISHLNEVAGLPVIVPVADNPVLDLLRRRIDRFPAAG